MIDYNELTKIKNDARERHVPILMDDSMEFIQNILKENHTKTLLEVGTAVGYSAMMFADVMEENSNITTIEQEVLVSETARNNIKKVGFNNIEVITGNAIEIMPKLISENRKYDVIFIDAAKGKYIDFFNFAMKLVEPGGYIIADNVLYKNMVMSDYNKHKQRTAVNKLREFIKLIENDERLESKVYNIGDGVSVSKVIKVNNH